MDVDKARVHATEALNALDAEWEDHPSAWRVGFLRCSLRLIVSDLDPS